MATIDAIVTKDVGICAIEKTNVPALRDDYLLVSVSAIALNPTDWKHVHRLTSPGARVGCDYAGTVEEVGSKVTKNFKKGDRVCGFAHGGNKVHHEDGAFAQMITVKGDVQIKIPDNLSFEEASTLGVGITTVGQSMYQSLGLPLPNKPTTEKTPFLIYGGSTATGSLAIQYAKLSGLHVITTCSEHNFDYVKSLGADAVFDYKSPTCSEDIKKYSNDSLKYALDCISEGDSPKITVSSLSSHGATYTTLLPVPSPTITSINPSITKKHTLGYTIFGEAFTYGTKDMPASAEDFAFGKMFWELSRDLLESGKVKVHRPSVDKYGKGLEGALKGMEEMRLGKVSGEKLVFTL